MWLLVKRLLMVEATLVVLTLIVWWATNDSSLMSLSVYLFRMGVTAIILGLVLVIGAGIGTRTETLAYLKPASHKRLLGDFAHRRKSYSVLNVLAMAGFIAMIIAVCLRELATR